MFCVRGTCPSYFRGVCTPLTEVSGRVGLRSAHRGTYMCQPKGQNLANVVFALLHREFGTPCHPISVLLPSAENSSGPGSKPTSLSVPTHDSPPRTIEECNYLVTIFIEPMDTEATQVRGSKRDTSDCYTCAARHGTRSMRTCKMCAWPCDWNVD